MTEIYGKQNSNLATFIRFDGKITSIDTNKTEFDSNRHIILLIFISKIVTLHKLSTLAIYLLEVVQNEMG
jgi:hypothetical protein